MSTKNPIKEQIKKYFEELKSARRYCQNVMTVLEEDNCLVKAEIGILLQEMPEFTFLKHQANFLKGNLRKVCSGELKVFDAYDVVKSVYLQIIDAMPVINETLL